MPMTQDDIKRHYEKQWSAQSDGAADDTGLRYSSPVEDAVLYPIYRQLAADLGAPIDGGRVLDVGTGSGRWIRFFLTFFKPDFLMGIDYTEASPSMLRKWVQPSGDTRVEFRLADVTDPGLDLGETFDWINVANVLFHIPEPDLFMRTLENLASLMAPGGRIVTTEYMPRTTMRTEWMLVRSRYDFEAAVRSVGLRIAEIRATTFFSNDPMGIDGPDAGVRDHFNRVRAVQQQLLTVTSDPAAKAALVEHMAEIERATIGFCKERIAPIDMPSQKLVVLVRDE